MRFADAVRARLAAGLSLPEPFAEAFDWLEENGFETGYDRPMEDAFQQRSLSIYPAEMRSAPGASHVAFHFEAGPPLHAPPAEAATRIATLARIAGDGGTLSLWRDAAEGKQHVVVFNHGIPHVLTDDPVVALQFLAMGYPEPAALRDSTQSAVDHALAEGYAPPLMPDAFRAFIEERFAVSIPACAADLGISIPGDGAPDPLRDWLAVVMPKPDAGSRPGFSAEHPFVVTPELRETIGETGIAGLRAAFPYVIEAP